MPEEEVVEKETLIKKEEKETHATVPATKADLVMSLKVLRDAMLKKIISDTDVIAKAFTDVKVYWDSSDWVNEFHSTLRINIVYKNALGERLGSELRRIEDNNGIRDEFNEPIKPGESRSFRFIVSNDYLVYPNVIRSYIDTYEITVEYKEYPKW